MNVLLIITFIQPLKNFRRCIWLNLFHLIFSTDLLSTHNCFGFFIHHALNGPPHCLRSQVKTVGKRGPAVDTEALAAVDSRDFDTMVDMVLRKHMELSHEMDCFVKEGRINISAQMLGIY